MEKAGFRVTVVNTLRFKVINLSTKKTDKNDARTLAEFLSRDILPQSHLCSAGSEGLRRILKSRSLLVEDAVALKNQAHAVLLAYGHITATAQFQSKAGRARLLEAVSSAEAAIVSIIFETLEAVEKQRKILEKRLREEFTVAGYVFFLNCEQAKRYRVMLLSGIDPAETAPMGIESYSDVAELLSAADLDGKSIMVIPNAGSVVPVVG